MLFKILWKKYYISFDDVMNKLRYLSYDVILIILLTGFIIVFFAKNAEALQAQQGPPVICGQSSDLLKTINEYEEEDFIVLMQTTPDSTYFILYRNIETGAWTVIAYNTPHLSSETACLMFGGQSSFIVPNLKQMKDIINKQDKGLEKSVPKLSERES